MNQEIVLAIRGSNMRMIVKALLTLWIIQVSIALLGKVLLAVLCSIELMPSHSGKQKHLLQCTGPGCSKDAVTSYPLDKSLFSGYIFTHSVISVVQITVAVSNRYPAEKFIQVVVTLLCHAIALYHVTCVSQSCVKYHVLRDLLHL